MAVGLNADTEYLRRSSIPSGGTGTLSDGGFTNCFAGVWLYRPSSTATYALTAGGSIIDFQAGAREVVLGFNSAGASLADLNLQIVFNSGGGTGTPYTFSAHAGDDFLDEWVYYFILDNSTSGQIAGYIPLSTMTAVSQARTNDNAGSQYINTLTFGNEGGGSAVVLGHYAYARARYGTGITVSDAETYAADPATISGDWGFWPLADNTDTGDDSGNSRTLTFNGTITTETSPTLSSGVTGTGAFTLSAQTVSGSGARTSVGTGAITLADQTVSGTGVRGLSGTGAIALGSQTVAGTGERTVAGSGAITLGSQLVAGTGVTGAVSTGTGAITVSAQTVAGTGTRALSFASAITLNQATVAGAGSRNETGVGSINIIAQTVAGSGTVSTPGTGSGNVQLSVQTVAGVGERTVSSASAITITAVTVSGVAERTVTGVGAILLSDLLVSGSSTPGVTYSGMTFPVSVVSASGRVRWVDYIPVTFVSVSADKINRFDADGAIAVDTVSTSGRVEWVDYIPVALVVEDSYYKWRFDDLGYIPVIEVA